MFFNLFAAAEPSANFCVAHGTLCSDPSLYPTFCNKPVKQWYCYNRIELWLWISSQAISVCFGWTPGSHSRNPEVPLRSRPNQNQVPRNTGRKTLFYSVVEELKATRKNIAISYCRKLEHHFIHTKITPTGKDYKMGVHEVHRTREVLGAWDPGKWRYAWSVFL